LYEYMVLTFFVFTFKC